MELKEDRHGCGETFGSLLHPGNVLLRDTVAWARVEMMDSRCVLEIELTEFVGNLGSPFHHGAYFQLERDA